jgi:hypothetical protein
MAAFATSTEDDRLADGVQVGRPPADFAACSNAAVAPSLAMPANWDEAAVVSHDLDFRL